MWQHATMLSLALLACAFAGGLRAPSGADTGQAVIANAWLTSHLVLLAGGCLLHARWRATEEPAIGWLAVAFLLPSFQLVPLAMLGAADPDRTWTAGINAPIDLICGPVVLGLILLASKKWSFPRLLNPISAAAALAVPCLALALAVTSLELQPPVAATHALTATVGIVAGLTLSWLTWLRLLHRLFLVLAVTGLAVAHDFHNAVARDEQVSDTGEFVIAAVSVVSAVLTVVLTLGLFRRALDRKARRIADYQARAEAAEEWLRREEELMHEIRATMAGISTATYVLHHGHAPTPVSEHELRTMLEAEVCRVQRLLSHTCNGQPGRIDLDELLLPQIVAQRALGHDVRWEPSGIAAFGRADNLTEAVHVVLTNATRYAAGGPVHVQATRWGDTANVSITDSGPGVAPEMRDVLFERGRRAESSPGQGVGLYLARKALHEDGGTIRLQEPSPGRGATFVISLRVASESDS